MINIEVYKNCIVEFLFRKINKNDLLFISLKAEARIDGKELILSYKADGSLNLWRGIEKGPGHYIMKHEGYREEGSLHRFEKARELVGKWVEESEDGVEDGLWRVDLNK